MHTHVHCKFLTHVLCVNAESVCIYFSKLVRLKVCIYFSKMMGLWVWIYILLSCWGWQCIHIYISLSLQGCQCLFLSFFLSSNCSCTYTVHVHVHCTCKYIRDDILPKCPCQWDGGVPLASSLPLLVMQLSKRMIGSRVHMYTVIPMCYPCQQQ